MLKFPLSIFAALFSQFSTSASLKFFALIFAFFFIVFLCVIFIKVRASEKRAARAAEDFKIFKPKIDLFFCELFKLKENFIAHRDRNAFLEKWENLAVQLNSLDIKKNHPLHSAFVDFKNTFENFGSIIAHSNRDFIRNQNEKYDFIFSDIDGKSLDIQQREVVISEEDRTLVLAGAGSGKTLTIAAKVKYLCEVHDVSPQEILLLSFTKKSAAEMTERIQDRLGVPLEATTFHKLGLDILKSDLGFRPEVFDDLELFVKNFFESELSGRQELVQKLTEYFAYYLDVPTDLEECLSLGELYEREKSADLETLKSKFEKEKFIERYREEGASFLVTLKGERVKSIEETKIANFLFMHGVNYEYEKLYPFESDDPFRKSYRPDFYLTDYDIYVEHFGISKDGRVPWLSKIEEKKYLDGIKWKRNFHKMHGTKLLETYSYYTRQGVLLERLESMLLENGIEFKPRKFNEIFETIYAKKSEKYFSEFMKLCAAFITLFKSSNLREENFELFKKDSRQNENKFMSERTCLFMDIAKIIFVEYQNYLARNKAIDFSDMINLAAEKVRGGAHIQSYKYVIVDEYQDISKSRFTLLKAIVDECGAKLLCVGDDWQSIYRFAGSDVGLFTEFEKYFGFSSVLKIERTYRNSQDLLDEASAFVLKNPAQLKKNLKSEKHLKYPLVFWGYDEEPRDALNLIVKKIIDEFGSEKSILFLGRTNYDFEILKKSGLFKISRNVHGEKISYIDSPETPMTFLSVHKSKGLEADNVVILNFKNDRLGFPNQISDDPILSYVLTRGETFLFAEERRLFYVAITRTKNRVFVLTDNKAPSIFFGEFSESERTCFVSTNKNSAKEKTKCPMCKTGDLLEVPGKGKNFIGCSNFPKCRYSLSDITILQNPKQCPECGGFLVKRKGRGHWFVGCTNYPFCKHTEEM